MGGPDQFGFVFHQAFEGEVAGLAHQFRSLFARLLARDAGFDAEQCVGVVFALVEDGLAEGAGGVWGGHGCGSLKFFGLAVWRGGWVAAELLEPGA